MKKSIVAAILIASLSACSNPKDTTLPSMDKIETIKPALEKLTHEERELVAGYLVRHTVGTAFANALGGKQATVIPEGTTIGAAIEEQRSFLAKRAEEEAKQKALQAKLKQEREAAVEQMRKAVTVTVVSKRIDVERGYSGIVMDEKIRVQFGYKNNTDKEIAGVKGRIVVKDLFGDSLSGFQISNDTAIPPNASITWTGSRSVKFSAGENQDRKLAELPDDKYVVEWEPQIIVFKDGTKLSTPD